MKVGILDNLEASERDKVKDRFKTEIKIMWEHNHDNLVKAMSCPEVFKVYVFNYNYNYVYTVCYVNSTWLMATS